MMVHVPHYDTQLAIEVADFVISPEEISGVFFFRFKSSTARLLNKRGTPNIADTRDQNANYCWLYKILLFHSSA
jgi:hypothetical protein